MNGWSRTLCALGVGAATAQAAPLRAAAQDFHDVTAGVGITGPTIVGGTYGPTGTDAPTDAPAVALTPETAFVMAAARSCVEERLDARALVSPVTGETVPWDVQEAVLRVMKGLDTPAALAAVLARGGAAAEAAALTEALVGLTGTADASRLVTAIDRLNALVDASSDPFLADPSDELLTVHAILVLLSLQVDCAPVPTIEVCVVTPEHMLTTVTAFVHPASGDTVVGGRPLRELYGPHQPQYASGHPWFAEDGPVPLQAGEFLKDGSPRSVPREELRRVGAHGEVAFFTSGADPARLYAPVGPGCEFQPYVERSQVERPIRVCVVTPRGHRKGVEAVFRPATGDTLVQGRPFREVHHAGEPQYAAGHDWFVEDQPIRHDDRELVKFGLRRVIDGPLRKVGEYRGVPVFAEVTANPDESPGEVLVPVGPGCEFQPYLTREAIRIRG